MMRKRTEVQAQYLHVCLAATSNAARVPAHYPGVALITVRHLHEDMGVISVKSFVEKKLQQKAARE